MPHCRARQIGRLRVNKKGVSLFERGVRETVKIRIPGPVPVLNQQQKRQKSLEKYTSVKKRCFSGKFFARSVIISESSIICDLMNFIFEFIHFLYKIK